MNDQPSAFTDSSVLHFGLLVVMQDRSSLLPPIASWNVRSTEQRATSSNNVVEAHAHM